MENEYTGSLKIISRCVDRDQWMDVWIEISGWMCG